MALIVQTYTIWAAVYVILLIRIIDFLLLNLEEPCSSPWPF